MATECLPCSLRARGETEAAERYEKVRSQRIVLAMINGAPDATALLGSEIRACKDCTARLAVIFMTEVAVATIALCGGVENAIEALQRGILEDLDEGDRQGP